jgi:hypothetical protein
MARHGLGGTLAARLLRTTWITTWSFWNTQFQWARPSMRTVVSSEPTIRERRSRARIAVTSLSKRGLARCNIASSAPSLIWIA